ncbi:protein of unknown function [Cupriavidus taiwanensis]|nr:protein of unknown function [Cupriavidus taiwanensis]
MALAWPSCCRRAGCWLATSTWERTAADRRSRCRKRSSMRCSGRPSSASRTAPRPRRCRCSRDRSAGRYGAGAAAEPAAGHPACGAGGAPAWRIRASGEFFSPAPVCVAIIRVLIRLRPRAPAAFPASPGQRQAPRYAAPTDELDSGPRARTRALPPGIRFFATRAPSA